MAPPVGVLPSPFVLRAANGKYLRRWYEFVRVYDEHKGPEFGIFYPEFKLPLVAIKAADTYWTYDPNWIKLLAKDTKGDNVWFRVVQVGPDQVAFFCTQNKRFLVPISVDGKTDSLNANESLLGGESVYTVEAAILNRHIENVVYDFSKKKETHGEPVVSGKVEVVHNGSKVALTINRTVSYSVVKEKSWSTSSSFTESVKLSAEFPVYGGAEAGFSISTTKAQAEATAKVIGGTVKDDTSVAFTAKPKHTTTAHFLLHKGSIEVPFSYDQTVQHFNGETTPKEHRTDGVFKAREEGVFANWKIKVEPLGIIEEVVEVIEDGEEVAGDVIETAGDAGTTITKTLSSGASTVTKTATGIAGTGVKTAEQGIGSIAKGVGGLFH